MPSPTPRSRSPCRQPRNERAGEHGLREGIQEAEIVTWHVSEGDHVVADQPLVSVETSKAVVEIPSPWSGHITKLYEQKEKSGKRNALAYLNDVAIRKFPMRFIGRYRVISTDIA